MQSSSSMKLSYFKLSAFIPNYFFDCHLIKTLKISRSLPPYKKLHTYASKLENSYLIFNIFI